MDVMITLQPMNIQSAAADLLWSRVIKNFPAIRIAGTHSGSPSAAEDEAIRVRIRESGARVLLVAYGMPAQERWLSRNLPRLPSVIVAEGAVDAQSLIAASDLVVSAGGSMNREAVALGVPVYTTYGGRLGGVDEALIRSGRLRPLTDPRALELQKRTNTLDWPRRDPSVQYQFHGWLDCRLRHYRYPRSSASCSESDCA